MSSPSDCHSVALLACLSFCLCLLWLLPSALSFLFLSLPSLPLFDMLFCLFLSVTRSLLMDSVFLSPSLHVSPDALLVHSVVVSAFFTSVHLSRHHRAWLCQLTTGHCRTLSAYRDNGFVAVLKHLRREPHRREPHARERRLIAACSS